MSVIVVGSSGGGTATLGHTDPQDLLRAINDELERINSCDENRRSEHGILYALFISCDASMDCVNEERDIATLWTVGIGEDCAKGLSKSFQVRPYYTGFLRAVNSKVKELEENILVPAIMQEKISLVKGMICISCDPKCVNFSSLSAAAKQHLPVTGSGGTSLSAAATTHEGLSIVGNAGGSVATTTYTRAVSYAYALSTVWKEPYSPFKGGQKNGKPKIGSILDACLPSFLAVCVSCKVLEFILQTSSTAGEIDSHGGDLVKSLTNYQFIQQLRYQALPSVCSVVAATSLAPEHGSTAVMAATVASISSWGSILAGLFAGWLVSLLLGRTLFMSIRLGIPATMTNIITAGFVGSSVALLCHVSGIVRLLSNASILIRTFVRTAPSFGTWNGQGYGFMFGCLFCYGSKVGWYHSIFLPMILIEMEHGEASIWGSIDICTLVLVSAGICAANVLLSRDVITRRGLKINLLCGDFIEVAYPYMEKSTIVNLSAYLASGIASEILYSSDPTQVMSSAYLPFPISIFLAHDTFRVSLAMLSAFTVSFLGMLLSILVDFFSTHADANKKRKND